MNLTIKGLYVCNCCGSIVDNTSCLSGVGMDICKKCTEEYNAEINAIVSKWRKKWELQEAKNKKIADILFTTIKAQVIEAFKNTEESKEDLSNKSF